MGLENRKFSIVPAYARQCLCRPAPAFVVQDLVSSPVPNCFKASTFRPRILTILVPWRTLYAVLPRLTRGDLSKFRCLPPPGVPHHDSGIQSLRCRLNPCAFFFHCNAGVVSIAPHGIPRPKMRTSPPKGAFPSPWRNAQLMSRWLPVHADAEIQARKASFGQNLIIHWSAIRYKKVYPSQIAVRLVKSVEHPHPSPPSRTARG